MVRFSREFRWLAERSVGSLVHPATPDDIRAELIKVILRVGADTYVRQNRAVAARQDLRPVLARIAVSTAVIVGRAVPRSRDIHERVPGSTFHAVDGCGHLPPIKQPEVTASLLRQLLARL